MPKAITCVNHPDRPAVARCYQCHNPICEQCKVVDVGHIFCSKKCASRYRAFQLRDAEQETKRNVKGIIYRIGCIILILIIVSFLILAGGAFNIPILQNISKYINNYIINKILF